MSSNLCYEEKIRLLYYVTEKNNFLSGARRFPKQSLQSHDTYTLHKPVQKNPSKEN